MVLVRSRRHLGGPTTDPDHPRDVGDLEAKYRTLLEQIPAIVYIWRVAHGLEHIVEEYVSPQIEGVLGFRSEDWMRDPHLWIDRLHPDDRSEVLDETARSVEAGEPFKLEYRMLARDGRVVWLHGVASVLARDEAGRATRYQGVQFDITARKEAEHAQRESFEQLRLLDRQRRDLLARLIGTQEEERRRIAEGIHDHTVQSLAAVQLRLEAIGRGHPELEELDPIRREVAGSIARLRHLTFELHPRILDTDGLEAALRSLLETATAGTPDAPDVRVEYRLDRDPPTEVGSTLYRIAQEAVANARQHAEASSVVVSVESRGGGFLARIEDEGKGFHVGAVEASRRGHLGLLSMRERAEAAGGWCRIESVPGSGTVVQGWIPDPALACREVRGADRPGAPDDVGAIEEMDPQHLPPSADLSPREIQVAELLALGHTNAEVAAILHLSVRTIEHHRSRVFHKLGVQSRAGLVQALGSRPAPGPQPPDRPEPRDDGA